MTKKSPIKYYQRSWIILFISIGITLAATVITYDFLFYIAEGNFLEIVDETTKLIDTRLATYEQVLNGGRAFFHGSENITREEWFEYVSALRISATYPGIQGIGFQKHTMDEEEFLRDMEELQNKNLLVRDFPKIDKHGYYNYIIYLEPIDERNIQALGYDMSSEPTRLDALQKSVQFDTTTISGKVKLVQEITDDVQAGFLMYLPFYEKDAPTNTIQERQDSLKGHIYAVFRMGDLMEKLTRDENRDVGFTIYDEKKDAKNIMYDYNVVEHDMYFEQAFATDVTIDKFHKKWVVSFYSDDNLIPVIDKWIPVIILISGLAMSGMLFIISNNQKSIMEFQKRQIEINKEITKRKDEFSAMVTHELRTPLTPILGNIDYLNNDSVAKNLTGEQKDAIKSIKNNALRLDNLITDVLDVEKISMQKMKFEYTHFDINEFLDEICKNFAHVAKERNITISKEADEPLEIYSDKQRLQQVFENIIGNACDFVPENDGKIVVSANKKEHTITFSVKDNGIGISEDAQKGLFKKFYQIDTSYTRSHGGNGLGLAICKGIVEGLGGEIWVKSTIDKGSTFYFSIPISNEQ